MGVSRTNWNQVLKRENELWIEEYPLGRYKTIKEMLEQVYEEKGSVPEMEEWFDIGQGIILREMHKQGCKVNKAGRNNKPKVNSLKNRVKALGNDFCEIRKDYEIMDYLGMKFDVKNWRYIRQLMHKNKYKYIKLTQKEFVKIMNLRGLT